MARIGTQEFLDIISSFEKTKITHSVKYDKNPRDSWIQEGVFQSGQTELYFKAFHAGYMSGRLTYLDGGRDEY